MSVMDLRALEIFQTVVAEGSVSKAAVKLNRVQSNISTRIKQLEIQVGKQLFYRQNRKLTLTSDGELLLSYANKLIDLSLEAKEALGENSPKGVFRIGAMESTAAARLPEILAHYSASYPDVEIELQTGTAGALMQRLAKGEIEVAFIAEPVVGQNIQTQPVFVENLVLIAPASYPKITGFEALDGKTLIAFEQGCAYRSYLEGWLKDANVSPGNVLSVSSYLAIFACVAAGTGFAVVPQSILNMIISTAEFQKIPLADDFAKIRTMLAHGTGYSSVKLDSFKKFLPKGLST
ncbi:MAG: LysR substrate-binding domain-containing protein [Sneathiella sp.]